MRASGGARRRADRSTLAGFVTWLGVIIALGSGSGVVILARRWPAPIATSARPARTVSIDPVVACLPVREMPAFAWPSDLAPSAASTPSGVRAVAAEGTPRAAVAGRAPPPRP